MNKFKQRIIEFKARLTSVSKEEPLNKLSLATIIILDLFILTLVFTGLNEHTQQLTTAAEYMPPEAQSIFIDQEWSSANRISELQPLILSDRNNYKYRYEGRFEERTIKLMHPASRTFYQQVKTLSQDKELHTLFLSRQKYVEERKKTEIAFDEAKRSYDTQLLENIANATAGTANAISTTARQYAQKIDQLSGEIRTTEQKINSQPDIQKLWVLITPDDIAREKIVSDYKHFQFWFPLKELGWQLVFLLPIFGIFYAWSARSVKNDNPIQTLIASHLLVIASLPIILKIIELVVDIIPKHFFKHLFNILQTLHLMALWHYFVIFFAIIVGLSLVYFIQRKVFDKQKMMQKRLMKNACISCNKRLPPCAKFCPFCGTRQLEECTACKQETPSGGPCCIHCGTSR
ncbi:MAG: zinc ribbon domain-containing protein [Kiritimatiellaceae bacterium]|nr:zinc ribbon domain-containing protein [Kiritimatiellaceae bacterium]